MRSVMLIGIILMLLGGVLLVVGHVSYKDTDPVIDVGSVEITKTETKHRRVPPLVSGTLLVVGAVLTVAGVRAKR